jgi:hypothetical protein
VRNDRDARGEMDVLSITDRRTGNTFRYGRQTDIDRTGSLRWMGHVLINDENKWMRRVMDINAEGSRPRGKPRKTWINVGEEGMSLKGLTREDANDREEWRMLPVGLQRRT